MIGTYFQGDVLAASFIDVESTSSTNFMQRNRFRVEETAPDFLLRAVRFSQKSLTMQTLYAFSFG
jgi:hypothetical protein